MSRHYSLDNLKVVLTVLVIFHHAGMAYATAGGFWAYTPSNPAEVLPWIWHFFAVNAGFFMGLYFLISGYFVPKSYDKQGCRIFVRKKLLRLGIPLIVMGTLLSLRAGRLELSHLWFIESLLLFNLIYALVRLIFKPISERKQFKPTLLFLLALATIMGLLSFTIRQFSPQDHWIWPFGIPYPLEPAHYPQYILMFSTGILAHRFGWIDKFTDRFGAVSLAIGALLSIGIWCVSLDCILSNGPLYGIYESFMCVFLSFGLIWLFDKFFNKTSTFMQWCTSQSYGAYIIHLLLMLEIQRMTDGIWMGAVGKFLFIALSTTVISFTFTWLLKKIPGFNKVL